MNHKDTLTPYVTSQIKANVPAATIKERLIQQGWGEAIVDEVIGEVSESLSTASSGPAPLPEVSNGESSQQPVTQPQVTTQPVVDNGYSVVAAFHEAMAALRANLVTIGIMTAIGIAVQVIVVTLAFVIGAAVLFSMVLAPTMGPDGVSYFSTMGRILPWLLLFLAATVLASAFMQAIGMIAINAGASGKKSAVMPTLKAGAKRTLRVALAGLLCVLIIGAPILLTVLLALVIGALSPALIPVIFILGALSVALAVVLILRLSIMPIVALFEPAVPLSKLVSRTNHLMSGGGVWFVAKYMLITVIISLILSLLTPKGNPGGPAVALSIGASIIIQGVLYLFYSAIFVVFYRNRKAVKG